jgi:hypothetical protein
MLKRSFGPKREPELPVEITRDFPRLSMDRINRNAVNTNKMFRGKDVKRGIIAINIIFIIIIIAIIYLIILIRR